MKTIFKSLFILSILSLSLFAQQPWVVGGNINGTDVLMTGRVSTALADSSLSVDTTKAANWLRSAVISNSVYLLSGRPSIRIGLVIIDTAAAGTTTTAPTVIVRLMGGLTSDTTDHTVVVDTVVSGARFYPAVANRNGYIISGTATTTRVKFPYYSLQALPSATLGTASTGVASAIKSPGRYRWFIIP